MAIENGSKHTIHRYSHSHTQINRAAALKRIISSSSNRKGPINRFLILNSKISFYFAYHVSNLWFAVVLCISVSVMINRSRFPRGIKTDRMYCPNEFSLYTLFSLEENRSIYTYTHILWTLNTVTLQQANMAQEKQIKIETRLFRVHWIFVSFQFFHFLSTSPSCLGMVSKKYGQFLCNCRGQNNIVFIRKQ